jgi:hypothetical protein
MRFENLGSVQFSHNSNWLLLSGGFDAEISAYVDVLDKHFSKNHKKFKKIIYLFFIFLKAKKKPKNPLKKPIFSKKPKISKKIYGLRSLDGP